MCCSCCGAIWWQCRNTRCFLKTQLPSECVEHRGHWGAAERPLPTSQRAPHTQCVRLGDSPWTFCGGRAQLAVDSRHVLETAWPRQDPLGLQEEPEEEEEVGVEREECLWRNEEKFLLQVRWIFRIVSGKGCLIKSKDPPHPDLMEREKQRGYP